MASYVGHTVKIEKRQNVRQSWLVRHGRFVHAFTMILLAPRKRHKQSKMHIVTANLIGRRLFRSSQRFIDNDPPQKDPKRAHLHKTGRRTRKRVFRDNRLTLILKDEERFYN